MSPRRQRHRRSSSWTLPVDAPRQLLTNISNTLHHFYDTQLRFVSKPRRSSAHSNVPPSPTPSTTFPLHDAVFAECFQYLHRNGAFAVEGIFRVPGNSTIATTIQQRFDVCENDVLELDCDVHDVACVLQRYFKAHKFFSGKLYVKLIAQHKRVLKKHGAPDASAEAALSDKYAELFSLYLSRHQQTRLRRMLLVVYAAAFEFPQNRMDDESFAKIFAPTLFTDPVDVPLMDELANIPHAIAITKFLLNHPASFTFGGETPATGRSALILLQEDLKADESRSSGARNSGYCGVKHSGSCEVRDIGVQTTRTTHSKTVGRARSSSCDLNMVVPFLDALAIDPTSREPECSPEHLTVTITASPKSKRPRAKKCKQPRKRSSPEHKNRKPSKTTDASSSNAARARAERHLDLPDLDMNLINASFLGDDQSQSASAPTLQPNVRERRNTPRPSTTVVVLTNHKGKQLKRPKNAARTLARQHSAAMEVAPHLRPKRAKKNRSSKKKSKSKQPRHVQDMN